MRRCVLPTLDLTLLNSTKYWPNGEYDVEQCGVRFANQSNLRLLNLGKCCAVGRALVCYTKFIATILSPTSRVCTFMVFITECITLKMALQGT
jgi:hypothetical protein